MRDNGRKILIENIQNCDSFPSNVVVSAIQGLCHLGERGDEKFLLPLLEHYDKKIAAAALSSLCFHFEFTKKLLNRIIQFASEYPRDEEEHELQRTAIFILADLATEDDTLLPFRNKLRFLLTNFFEIVILYYATAP
ncbi:hypothetical protein FACS1894170_04730 [Planctomycetales bacterium]|nr:hypothetical protein FACS1894170_04730 [Planctomycetales bacterium]